MTKEKIPRMIVRGENCVVGMVLCVRVLKSVTLYNPSTISRLLVEQLAHTTPGVCP